MQHTAVGKSNTLPKWVFSAHIHTEFMVGLQPPLSANQTGVILGKKEEEEHPMQHVLSAV